MVSYDTIGSFGEAFPPTLLKKIPEVPVNTGFSRDSRFIMKLRLFTHLLCNLSTRFPYYIGFVKMLHSSSPNIILGLENKKMCKFKHKLISKIGTAVFHLGLHSCITKLFSFALHFIGSHMCVNVNCSAVMLMAHETLNIFRIHTFLKTPGAERMTNCMRINFFK